MKKYALFFDIDGTLVSFKTHAIPPSTILALTQAKANGHKVFIATGRPPLIITNLGAIEHLIDGYVTINGALCFVGDEVIRCKEINKDEAWLVVRDAEAKGYGLIVVGERDVAVLDPKGDVDRIFRGEIAVENLDQARPIGEVMEQRILQLTPFFDSDYEQELMTSIPGCTSGRWHPAFTDITARGADKGEGITAMAAHLGLDPESTMAFGDGGNDTSMIRRAGIGIAMGNALETLKQEADYVTTSVDEDGVMNALRHFELIIPAIERHPLEPFLPENARVLFLGSFPPQKKRWCMEFYYPNFINDHWRLEGEIFFGNLNHFVQKERKAFDREAIIEFCKEKGIAFYDTATAVRRLKDNASDEFLEVVEPTDIRRLLVQLPHCEAIVTTGQKATDTLCRYFSIEDSPKVGESIVIPDASNRDGHLIRLYRLPSSSRAYPLAFDKKAAAYRNMFEAVKLI